MSTIHALNYGNGSNSVPASAVLDGTAKTWARFTTDSPTTLLDSYNVGSLTDNAAGNTLISYTSAMANANSAGCGASTTSTSGDAALIPVVDGFTTVRFVYRSAPAGGGTADAGINSAVMWGDRA